jgi:hypothetical protein
VSYLTLRKSLTIKDLRARRAFFCKCLIIKAFDLLLSFRFCRKITFDLLPSFRFWRKIRFCKLLFIKDLRKVRPCSCNSLMLSYLQEVSKVQATRRDVVKKSLTQKVFCLTIFHSESISFFI